MLNLAGCSLKATESSETWTIPPSQYRLEQLLNPKRVAPSVSNGTLAGWPLPRAAFRDCVTGCLTKLSASLLVMATIGLSQKEFDTFRRLVT